MFAEYSSQLTKQKRLNHSKLEPLYCTSMLVNVAIYYQKEKLCSPVGLSLNRRFAFKHHNSVCQIGCHDEIMLDNKTSLFGVKDETIGENIFEEKNRKFGACVDCHNVIIHSLGEKNYIIEHWNCNITMIQV